MKTVYCLRIRPDDKAPWGQVEYYKSRKERDHLERLNRCLGGIRTHAYEEKKTLEEIEQLEFSENPMI